MGVVGEEQHRIREEWSILQEEWEHARQQWKDEIGEYFEREYWSDMEIQVPGLLKAMEELDETLEQALHNTDE
jgi:hypothetical protein